MSSFAPVNRIRVWKCPKCGEETTTVKSPFPWILPRLPLFGSGAKAPLCPKCKTQMTEVKLRY